MIEINISVFTKYFTLMKYILILLSLVAILSCQNQDDRKNGNEFTIYSVSLIESGEYNQDLLACCFTSSQPKVFINQLSEYGIKEVDFPMAKKIGLNYYGWKVKKNSLDSTIFVLGLSVRSFQITEMQDDSINLKTQEIKMDPRINIILKNDDSLRLDNYDFKELNKMKPIFSVNDDNWIGIDF